MATSKKLLAFLLAMSMVLALLAGCGSTNETASSGSATPAEESSASTASAEEQSAEAPAEEQPAEPETAGTAASAPETEPAVPENGLPLCDEPTTLTMIMSWSPQNAGGLLEELTEIKGIQAAEELTNVTVDFTIISSESYDELFSLAISSGDIPDMLSQAARSYPGGLLTGVEEGILANIYPYMQEHAPDYWAALNQSEATVQQATIAEETMAAMYMLREVGDATTGLVIRQDWLDALGLDMPQTYDDYENVLTAFKDEYGLTSAYMLHQGLQTATFFTGGFGTSGFTTGTNTQQYMQSYYQVDGTVHCSLVEDGYKEYLQLMNKWYEAGLISKDFLSMDSIPFKPDYTQEVYDGNAGLWHGRADSIESYAASMVDENAVVAPAPAAVRNPGDTYHFVDTHYISLNTSMAFSAECENLELAIEWINFWFTDEGAMLYCYGVEDDTYRMNGGEIELTEVCTENEMGMPAPLILQFLTPEGKWPGLQYASLEFYGTGALAAEAVEVWSEGDDAWIIPSTDVLTEYLSEYNASFSDISTYAMETASAFIIGNKDFSEWDSYLESLEAMGMSRCLEIMQETYDAFVG